MAEAVERSIDDVAAQVKAQATMEHTGHSSRGHVAVTVTATVP